MATMLAFVTCDAAVSPSLAANVRAAEGVSTKSPSMAISV